MTVYCIPEKVSAICFDIDNTLYRNDGYSRSQTDLLQQKLGDELGWDSEKVLYELQRVKEITQKEQSQGNWFKMLGISIETSVKWREELLKPMEYLSRDRKLAAVLDQLKQFNLCALTNNPSKIGLQTLEALGVEDYFSFIIGLDDTYMSKPSPEPFIAVEKNLDISPEEIVMIGDRYDVDLAVPLERGWGAVLVDNMEDVYALPGLYFLKHC